MVESVIDGGCLLQEYVSLLVNQHGIEAFIAPIIFQHMISFFSCSLHRKRPVGLLKGMVAGYFEI